MNLMEALMAKKMGGGGGSEAVTPQSVLNAMEGMDAGQQSAARAAIGATDTTTGLADSIKQAILDCFDHVAWAVPNGQDYVDALEAAMYPLQSISAVYTQSGTVYDTDSLDSLKADLVVTATYENGDTETVDAADYTLSGTLTEGTSTITVSYGGKTTTFTVTVTHSETPAGYTFFDYLKRASASNDYIITDLVQSPSFAVLDFEFWFETNNTSGNTDAVFGCRTTNSAAANKNEVALFVCDSAKNAAIRISTFGTPYQDFGSYIANTMRHIVYKFNNGNSYFTVDDGESIYVTNAVSADNIPAQTTYPLWLLNVNAGGSSQTNTSMAKGATTKFGKIIFYQAGTNTKVYELVPAYNGEKYGYYEKVHNVFYAQKNAILGGGDY